MDIGDAFHSCTDEDLARIAREDSREIGLDRFDSLHLSPAEEDAVNTYLNKRHAVDKAVESKIDVVNLEIFEEIKPEG